ncbi:MAG: hypothetical protein AB7D37_10910 [Desulfovibrio sp.]
MAYDFDDINLSRRIRCFVTKETVPGTPEFPAATDFICPAGDATINQASKTSDSKEMADTLDKLDKLPGGYDPAEWALPMYLRMGGIGVLPQGHALFRALQGKFVTGLTATVNGALADDAADIPYEDADGVFPPVGVIRIGTETIRYTGNTGTSFTGCTRAYNSTVAATAADGAAITLLTQVYQQDPSAEKFTYWLMTDWFLQFVAGATINACTADIKNEDGVLFSFKGQGTRMGFAAIGQLAEAAAEGATTIKIELPDGRAFAKAYSEGARIQNKTKDATNGTSGFKITDVDTDTNVITISPAVPAGGWAEGDSIMGYLPPASPIGDIVLNRSTKILIDGTTGKFRSTSLSIGVPKDYKNDELGTVFPETVVPGERDINMELDSYFRTADTLRFGQAFTGDELAVEIQFGDTPGYRASLYMARAPIESPALSRDSGTTAIKAKISALGSRTTDSVGENSLVIGLE